MPLSRSSLRDSGGAGSSDPDAADRLRSFRDRLEAVVFGLGELEYLRERQEAVVRAALEREEEKEPRRLPHRSSEENILLLRKQLSCLRRKDAVLITQLQELDQQISDLRLDPEGSHDQLETDSRPSSGFYELSDGTSGSLSNSSHSVFSEGFCPAADTDGHFQSTEELVSCLDSSVLVGGLCDDLSPFAAVCHSLSTPPPRPINAASLVVSDSQSKSPGDPLACNIYCYLSPLCAVAIQSSTFLQTFSSGARGRDDTGTESLKPEPTPPSDSVSDPQIFSSSQNNMDSYIYSLLQRRAQPIRTSRPRTSIIMDPSKSLQQQAGLCVRPAFSPSPAFGARAFEIKPCQSAEEQEANVIQTGLLRYQTSRRTLVSNRDVYRTTNGLTRKRSRGLPPLAGAVKAPLKDLCKWGPPTPNSSPKETSCCSTHQELLLKSPPPVRTQLDSPKNRFDLVQSGPVVRGEKSDLVGGGGRGRRKSSKNGPSKQNGVKPCRGSNKNTKNSTKMVLVSQNNEPPLDRRCEINHQKPSSKKFQVLEGGASAHIKVSTRRRCVPAAVLEHHLSSNKATAALNTVQSAVFKQYHRGNRHHHHGRSQAVVTKPKSKRSDYCRLHAIMEVPSDGAARRAQRRQRKEVLSSSGSNMHPSFRGQRGGYAAASDSEYSAECVSLFHSTIVDTSEDDKSNYTTNCFGDGLHDDTFIREELPWLDAVEL
ncbi:dapper homolog 1 isoform X2 [Melanotaenia boesemani]|uniref:dapper homolog 1 isoform X2 n=1 Tax=Melanotaenia boesemani TaxID=1250792 RepID=UPI001C04EA25|nr:dapper homolog 1 isoform X2 [Melanotaenia boesemani]